MRATAGIILELAAAPVAAFACQRKPWDASILLVAGGRSVKAALRALHRATLESTTKCVFQIVLI